MSEAASFENNEKFAKVEERINHILTRDEGIKTNYSELRNFYSIIGNDIKGAISKKMAKMMLEVNSFNETFIKGKTPKKDKLLAAIERDFDAHLQKMPDVSPQNTATLYQFLRELMPLFIQIKAHTAKQIKAEKKAKRKKQQENLLQMTDMLSRDVHNLYIALLHFSNFDQYSLKLIRSKVNRDYTKELVKNIHAVIKQSFKLAKNETLDIKNLRAIDLMTMRIRIRLGIYESCEQFSTYSKILKSLPRQLVQQFNARYFARRRDSTTNIEELKDTTEYKDMTKKFITLKLKKYYNLLRLYQVNVNRLFIIEDRIEKGFADYLEKTESSTQIGEKAHLLESLQVHLNDAVNKFLTIHSGLPKNEDLKKNSIRTLFSYVVSFYYNVLKDTYTPLNCREIAIRSMKLIKPPKDMMLNPVELKYLNSEQFKRDEKVLTVFFQGILSLVSGEEEESAVVDPLMTALGEDVRRTRKVDLRQRAINRFVKEISPVEFDLLIQILDIVPRDEERINSELGKLFVEIAETYPNQLKHQINRAEKVEPTDAEPEKIRKIVTEKYDRLLLKTIEFQTDKPSPVEYLKKVQEEEQTFVTEEKEAEEMQAVYNISNLITHWKNETEKTVVGFFLESDEKNQPAEIFREFGRREIKKMNEYFNSEHLGEIEKHYKTLNENIGQIYLSSGRPYSKTEYILLYAAKRLMVEFRNPAKSFPRLHERLAAISTGK